MDSGGRSLYKRQKLRGRPEGKGDADKEGTISVLGGIRSNKKKDCAPKPPENHENMQIGNNTSGRTNRRGRGKIAEVKRFNQTEYASFCPKKRTI